MNTGLRLLIKGGRVIDPATGTDETADVAIANGRVLAIKDALGDFQAEQILDAAGCLVIPGLVDLAVRLREPGHEHTHMLASEMSAAVAGGITSLVCQPDTDPVLDEPGLVEMLRFRAEKLQQARVYPLGALTRGLQGQSLTEMVQLTDAGCVAFGQANAPMPDTRMMQHLMQYASTFGYAVWLHPLDNCLGQGAAASGPLATRMGLVGIPVAAETIALHTLFELMQVTGVKVHLCRLSSSAGVALVRQAKARGLPVTSDVSINSLHLTDEDIGYFDSRAHLTPPLRQAIDRQALSAGLADGTIDALVSDHTPVDEESKALPFAQSEAGATGLELLLSLAWQWHLASGVPIARALAVVTCGPASVLGTALGTRLGRTGHLHVGGEADVCVFDPHAHWTVSPHNLCSQAKHTPFAGRQLPGRVRATVVGGRVAFVGN